MIIVCFHTMEISGKSMDFVKIMITLNLANPYMVSKTFPHYRFFFHSVKLFYIVYVNKFVLSACCPVQSQDDNVANGGRKERQMRLDSIPLKTCLYTCHKRIRMFHIFAPCSAILIATVNYSFLTTSVLKPTLK